MRTLNPQELAVIKLALAHLRGKTAIDSALYVMLHDTIKGIDVQISEVSRICTELQHDLGNAEQVTIGMPTASE